jgi:hypothetical protein
MFPVNTNSAKLKKSSFLWRFKLKEKISAWIYPIGKKLWDSLQAPGFFLQAVQNQSLKKSRGENRRGIPQATSFTDK